jgi:uncharacterized protein YutE (UPF0331/DUF86 family)
MIDPLRLRALLERLGDEVADLRRLAEYDAATLLADRDKLKSAKYGFVVAIEICIDAGQHIIASHGYRAPSNYDDVFVVLGEKGVLPRGDVPTLIAMAGFRNLLVHGYAAVDDGRVIATLHDHLDDFDRYRRAIAASTIAETRSSVEDPPSS